MMTTLSLKRVNLCRSESVMENTKKEAFGKNVRVHEFWTEEEQTRKSKQF